MTHKAAKDELKRIFMGIAPKAGALHLESQQLLDKIYDEWQSKGPGPVDWEYKIFIPGVLVDVNALGVILRAQSQDGWQFICEAQDRLVFGRPKS